MRPIFNHRENFMTTRHHPTASGQALGLRFALTCVLACALPLPAQAHRNNAASELSALSFMPVALSVVAPMALVSVAGVYTLKAVELSAEGTVWVLERTSDGVRVSVTLASDAAAGASMAVGTIISALACSAGWVLHAAGKVVAIVPNAVGQALIYNERVTR